MLHDFIHIISLIVTRTYRFIQITLMLLGMQTVLHPIATVIGFGIFAWLANNVSWYLEFWVYSVIGIWILYLTSCNYRSWSELALGYMHLALNQKYP